MSRSPHDHVRHLWSRDFSDPVEGVLEKSPDVMRTFSQIEVQMRRVARRRAVRRACTLALNLLLFAALVSFAVLAVYQFTDRRPAVVAENKIITPEVPIGAQLGIRVKMHRLRTCEGLVRFVVIDSEGHPREYVLDWAWPFTRLAHKDVTTTGVTSERTPQPDGETLIRRLTIADLTPGPARLRIVREWRCPYNIVQQYWPITSVSADMPFTILPRVVDDAPTSYARVPPVLHIVPAPVSPNPLGPPITVVPHLRHPHMSGNTP